MKIKFKIILLKLASVLVSVLPLFALLIANRDRYMSTPSSTVKLCLGGVLILVFAVINVLGRLKNTKRIIIYSALVLLSWFLESVLRDLTVILMMAWLGEFLDMIFFQPAIKKMEEKRIIDKTADATAAKVEEIMQTYIGNGRV